MMTPLTLLTNDELLQRMAVYNNRPEDLTATKCEVIRRISKESKLTDLDLALVSQLIEKATEIEDEDFDMISQTNRGRKLSAQYAEIKNQILARMKEQDQLCQCSA